MRTFFNSTAAVAAAWAAAIALAHPQQSQATDTAKVSANPAKEFRKIERRIDALRIKCDACNGRGKVKRDVSTPGRGRRTQSRRSTFKECSRCGGTGWADPVETARFRGQFPRTAHEIEDEKRKAQERLDAFADYFELADRYGDALSENKNKRLAARVHENRSRFLDEIVSGMGMTTMQIMTAPGRYEERPVARLYTGLAINLILGKTSPVGHGVAFSGRIARKKDVGYDKLAEVEIETVRGHVTCFVVVPDGVRWVRGANVRVIGRVIDPSGFTKLGEDAMVVQPCSGTE